MSCKHSVRRRTHVSHAILSPDPSATKCMGRWKLLHRRFHACNPSPTPVNGRAREPYHSRVAPFAFRIRTKAEEKKKRAMNRGDGIVQDGMVANGAGGIRPTMKSAPAIKSLRQKSPSVAQMAQPMPEAKQSLSRSTISRHRVGHLA